MKVSERLITTSIVEGNREGSMAICPHCGQKLFVISGTSGDADVVIKCRRCRSYIRVQTKG